MLVDRLDRIRRDAASDPAIEFASRPKRHATETREGGPRAIRADLAGGCTRTADGGPSASVQEMSRRRGEPKKRGPEGAPGLPPDRPTKANRTVRVQPKRKCPKGHGTSCLEDEGLAERTLIDLVFTRNGCRKTVTRYEGKKRTARSASRHYEPPAIVRLGNQAFGHAFQAWTVYQRVVLRLPYRIIAQVTEHLFGVGLSASSRDQLPPLPGRLLRPHRGGHPPGDPQERLRPRR